MKFQACAQKNCSANLALADSQKNSQQFFSRLLGVFKSTVTYNESKYTYISMLQSSCVVNQVDVRTSKSSIFGPSTCVSWLHRHVTRYEEHRCIRCEYIDTLNRCCYCFFCCAAVLVGKKTDAAWACSLVNRSLATQLSRWEAAFLRNTKRSVQNRVVLRYISPRTNGVLQQVATQCTCMWWIP